MSVDRQMEMIRREIEDITLGIEDLKRTMAKDFLSNK